MPKVSIAIAIYNVERYLSKCLISIQKQTFLDFEVLMVDDGSTDGSARICQMFTNDSRFILLNKENGGLSSARQLGLDKANGEYICFVDPDDYLDPDYVERMYTCIENQSADICVCGYRDLKDGKQRDYIISTQMPSPVYLSDELLRARFHIFRSAFYLWDSWNKMYKRDFLIKTKIPFCMPRNLNGTDMSFNHRVFLQNPIICYVNKVLYNHVYVEGSAVHRKSRNLLNSYQIILDQLEKDVLNKNFKKQMELQFRILYVSFLKSGLMDLINDDCSFVVFQKRFFSFKKAFFEKHKLCSFYTLKMFFSISLKSKLFFLVSLVNSKLLYILLRKI